MTTNRTADPRTAAARTVPVRETPLLRWALDVDGVVSATNGLVYVAAAGVVADLLGLPTALLVPVGVFLLVYGAALVVVSMRRRVPVSLVRAVIVLNAIWVIDSLVVAVAGWFDLTAAGVAWILLQAVAVAACALAQAAGLRRA